MVIYSVEMIEDQWYESENVHKDGMKQKLLHIEMFLLLNEEHNEKSLECISISSLLLCEQ